VKGRKYEQPAKDLSMQKLYLGLGEHSLVYGMKKCAGCMKTNMTVSTCILHVEVACCLGSYFSIINYFIIVILSSRLILIKYMNGLYTEVPLDIILCPQLLTFLSTSLKTVIFL